MNKIELLLGDCLEKLKELPDNSVDCCITSPPYYGLRDYGVSGQIGLEQTPQEYVQKMVNVFSEVKRVLKPNGTLWLNLGDSYGKQKQLIGIPWRVAFALQDSGWYLRQDIIWHKPNPMPESIRDRCTKAHEYIFLLSKSPKYYFDSEAIKEPSKHPNAKASWSCESRKARGHQVGGKPVGNEANGTKYNGSIKRNKRSVWTVTPKHFKGAHFATFPPDLIEPCVLAGCPKEGIVLDPFMGSGTTGLVAKKHGRDFIGIELNEEYLKIAEKRIKESMKEIEGE